MINNPATFAPSFNESDFIYPESQLINKCHEHLKTYGIFNITDFFSSNIKEALTEEIFYLFNNFSKRKDFHSAHTNTPRHMFTVGEQNISQHGEIIKDFYYSDKTLKLLNIIAGEKIDFLPWMGERFVINGLIHNQDTHGWHWDDYAYALVFIAECPQETAGGEVQCIPNTIWDKNRPDIQNIVATSKIYSYHFAPRSFYLMKSDTTLHRVSKVLAPHRRLSISFSYCNQNDLLKQLDHKTVLDLYD